MPTSGSAPRWGGPRGVHDNFKSKESKESKESKAAGGLQAPVTHRLEVFNLYHVITIFARSFMGWRMMGTTANYLVEEASARDQNRQERDRRAQLKAQLMITTYNLEEYIA